MLVIHKFGGTSLGHKKGLNKVAKIIEKNNNLNNKNLVVVSAINPNTKETGVTQLLLNIINTKFHEESIKAIEKNEINTNEIYNNIIHSQNYNKKQQKCIQKIESSILNIKNYIQHIIYETYENLEDSKYKKNILNKIEKLIKLIEKKSIILLYKINENLIDSLNENFIRDSIEKNNDSENIEDLNILTKNLKSKENFNIKTFCKYIIKYIEYKSLTNKNVAETNKQIINLSKLINNLIQNKKNLLNKFITNLNISIENFEDKVKFELLDKFFLELTDKIKEEYDKKPEKQISLNVKEKYEFNIQNIKKIFLDKESKVKIKLIDQVLSLIMTKIDCKWNNYPEDSFLKEYLLINQMYFHAYEPQYINTIKEEILSLGELISAELLQTLLEEKKIKSQVVNLSHIINPSNNKTKNNTNLKTLEKEIEQKIENKIQPIIKEGKIPITTGFIGILPKGILKTIDRGYTDYTASLIASSLKAEKLNIWKETNGIYTADPKIVKSAQPINEIQIEETLEMCIYGSPVIHSKAMSKCIKNNITIQIKNTFNPKHKGTTIKKETSNTQNPITSITSKKNIIIFNIHSIEMLGSFGFITKVGEIFSKNKIPVDLISTSQVNISLTVELKDIINEKIENQLAKKQIIDHLNQNTKFQNIKQELEKISNLKIIENLAMISIIGKNIKNNQNVQSDLFRALSKENIKIHMISQDANKINISLIINKEKLEDSINLIHNKFFINKKKAN